MNILNLFHNTKYCWFIQAAHQHLGWFWRLIKLQLPLLSFKAIIYVKWTWMIWSIQHKHVLYFLKKTPIVRTTEILSQLSSWLLLSIHETLTDTWHNTCLHLENINVGIVTFSTLLHIDCTYVEHISISTRYFLLTITIYNEFNTGRVPTLCIINKYNVRGNTVDCI